MTEDNKQPEFDSKKRLDELFTAFEILNQLNMFPRFRDFVNLNYDISKNVDPETGAITMAVLEALPEEVGARMKRAAMAEMQREIEEIKVATPDQIKEIVGK